MNSEVRELGWRPGWAVAVATVGIVLVGAMVVFGLVGAWNEVVHPAPWIGQVPSLFTLPLFVVALLVGVPWVVFLSKGGQQSLTQWVWSQAG